MDTEPEAVEWGFRLANLGRGNRRKSVPTTDAETLGSAWGGRINQIPDAVGNPEDLLIAKEGPEDDVQREEVGFGVFVSKLGPYINRLPKSERDTITLVWLQERTQEDAAEILGITQQAVSWRLQRGMERLKFWVAMPTWTHAEFHRAIVLSMPEIESAFAASFWRTTCVVDSASEFGIHPNTGERMIRRVIDRLKAIPELEAYGDALAKLHDAGMMGAKKRRNGR